MTQEIKIDEHTPGPWEVDTFAGSYVDSCHAIIDEHNTTIAHVEDWSSEPDTEAQAWGNAYLIAAAPDLLSALKCHNVEKAYNDLRKLLTDPDSSNDQIFDEAVFLCDEMKSFFEERNAAILKARAGNCDPS